MFGFITMDEGIKIHRVNCPNAVQLMSNFAYRIVKARWKGKDTVEFLAGIRFSGIDDVGLVNKITTIISHEHNVNMRAISFESNDGIFAGQGDGLRARHRPPELAHGQAEARAGCA